MNIQIEFIAPPVGTAAFDYMAYDAAEDEEGRATGYGATREAALTDLVEKIQMEAYAEGRKDEAADWVEDPYPTALVEAARDMLNGWKYIRRSHGDLYGVGWDRAQNKMEAALEKFAAPDAPIDTIKHLPLFMRGYDAGMKDAKASYEPHYDAPRMDDPSDAPTPSDVIHHPRLMGVK